MKADDWQSFVADEVQRGSFGIDRSVYLDPEIFAEELTRIFEKTWVFLAHESQLPNIHDYFTTHIGRQPVVLIRGEDGQIRGFINACPHRGATLCRTERGNRKFIACSYHGWTFDTTGRNVDIKDQASGAYPPAFDEASHDLGAIARVESYRGFIFGCLDAGVRPLSEHLGQSKPFIDLMADQSPEGLEVLPGRSRYISQSNWKFQAENGVDGYHVTSVHGNYMQVVQRRAELGMDKVKSIARGNLGQMPSGAYDLGDGHTLLWGEVPGGAETRPLNERRAELERRVGAIRTHWMINRSRNLGIFPNVLLMDQTSTQIRVFRPLAVDRTEVTIYGIAPKGESAAARSWRIRQYEDFFNATGMATPDDLSEFRASQDGLAGLRGQLQTYDRGLARVQFEPDEAARELGVSPRSVGPNWADENIMHSIYREWMRLMADA